jgi:hypothetical protein
LPGVQVVGVEVSGEGESVTLRVRLKESGVVTSLDVPVDRLVG